MPGMDENAPESVVNKCSCENQESLTSEETRERRRSFPLGLFNLRKSQSLNLQTNSKKLKKTANWIMKLNCAKNDDVDNCEVASSSCHCTCYKQSDEIDKNISPVVVEEMSESNIIESVPEEVVIPQQPVQNEIPAQDVGVAAAAVVVSEPPAIVVAAPAAVAAAPSDSNNSIYNRGVYSTSSGNIVLSAPFVDIQWIRSIHEDCDEAARLQRAREIEQGVEPPPNFRPVRRVQLLYSDVDGDSGQVPRRLQLVCSSDLTVDSLRAFFQNMTLKSCPMDTISGCHTQIDFIHCLVPDLLNITNCSFYWGKMDRYEAERLLEGKPEGTFLLRDSAQEEFLFSVSFRKYNRSLHARIEQWNHKFSFDSHDPGVYTSDTVCGLIEHYKDPSSCMFFEPMLTWPLHRKFTFSLQHMCRAVIVSKLGYDDINVLQLPKPLKSYLKEYHYRQKVRVERFDDDVQWLDLRSVPP